MLGPDTWRFFDRDGIIEDVELEGVELSRASDWYTSTEALVARFVRGVYEVFATRDLPLTKLGSQPKPVFVTESYEAMMMWCALNLGNY